MIVPGEGAIPCDWMLLGQNPGHEELLEGRPFVGKAGQHLWSQMRRYADMGRDDFYVTNAVKIGTPKNRLPNRVERAEGLCELLDEIERVHPSVIVTAGAFATQMILGDVHMANVHGIPHEVELMGQKLVCIPMYHPAAGLHKKGFLPAIAFDLERVGAYRRSEVPVWAPSALPCKVYRSLTGILWPGARSCVALDTEGWPDRPWGLTYSVNGRDGHVISADNKALLSTFNKKLKGKTVVLHNGLHDLAVLRAMGVHVHEYHDTMVLAYHDMMMTGSGILEAESQNLGTLAYRECNLQLGELKDCEGVDLDARVIPFNDAVIHYAGMDPIATWRLFQVYRQRGLLEYQPYQIDMGQVGLVDACVSSGVPFDVDHTTDYYLEIRDKKAALIEKLRAAALKKGLKDFNPGSHPQVRRLLVEKEGLRIYKRTKGGLASTGQKAIADHKSNPFVQMIQSYRELDKLEGTYLFPLLEELCGKD